MNNAELRSLRESLGLSPSWCAENVGFCSLRTWQYWETGRAGKLVPVPADVQRRMEALSVAIQRALEA